LASCFTASRFWRSASFSVSHGLCPLPPRNDREHHSDYEPKRYGPSVIRCARRGFAAGKDVFCLERCRLALFLRTSLREPLFSCSQIFAAQKLHRVE